jgi:glyoxylase-like metal-dependent hydrolase (beta-lactamase superfamily II)
MMDKRLIEERILQIPADKPGSHSYVFYGDDLTVLVDPGLESNANRVREVLGGIRT